MNQRLHWRRFVERRRRELHDVYPCAMPTGRQTCPKHGVPVPQSKFVRGQWVVRDDGTERYVAAHTIRLSGICKRCRDELYEQLAAEYVHQQRGEAA